MPTPPAQAEPAHALPRLSKLGKVLMTLQLCGINFTSSGVTGILTVCLPILAADLQLPEELYFWPLSAYVLATASTILVAGSLADVLGHREVDLAGAFCTGTFMIAGGLARTGSEFVAFRALQGLGMSLHFSSSVGIVAYNLPRGRSRNISFSCLGLSQVLGFSSGLVLGGVLADTIGWQAGCYLFGGLTLLFSTIGIWALPETVDRPTPRTALTRLTRQIDWVGAGLASTFMSLMSYLLAVLSTDIYAIRNAESIVLMCLSLAAVPLFIFWMNRQVKLGKPALIPNSLWRNSAFSSICLTVALSYAVLASLELFASLFFQNIQRLSALEASLRMLPSLVLGGILNLTTGLFIDKVPPVWLVSVSSILCAGSPLLLALINPEWSYWTAAFVAQLLQPISGDILFTVGLIVVSEVFPEQTQALAGAVFNTASQFGQALGLAVTQVVSALITKQATARAITETEALMAGYRASFWTMFAFMLSCMFLGAWGLRKTDRIGLKVE
ncbi:MFS general substrate transporter [Thozetella sp. PMI_491]|nr:MFS general substrate transporter [Thozetella sp. PMI_491]